MGHLKQGQAPVVLDGWRAATWILLLVATATAGLSMLGHLGRWWWVFDLAAALRPPYAAVLALTTVLVFAVGARRAALAVAVVALIEAGTIASLWIAAPPPAAADASLLRVHFHNVHGGGDERFADVARELASSDADVVFLVETSSRWIELLGDADVPYELVYPRRWEDHRQLLVLSRLPIDGAEAVPLAAGSRSGGSRWISPWTDAH